MKLSDARIIHFLASSPLPTFAAMLDALKYLDGRWTWEDIEYELFDDGLGDNPQDQVAIRVPAIGGIPANALLSFTWHAKKMHMLRRRTRPMRDPEGPPDEIVVYYQLTAAGRAMIIILEALEAAKNAS